jgi:hypothetical protein
MEDEPDSRRSARNHQQPIGRSFTFDDGRHLKPGRQLEQAPDHQSGLARAPQQRTSVPARPGCWCPCGPGSRGERGAVTVPARQRTSSHRDLDMGR